MITVDFIFFGSHYTEKGLGNVLQTTQHSNGGQRTQELKYLIEPEN